MENKDLLTVTAPILAIILAIFILLMPKAVDVYHTRWKAMLNVDMPINIRNSKMFRAEVFLDNTLMFILAGISLLGGIYFISVLINAVSLIMERKPPFLFNSTLQESFLFGLDGMYWLFSGLLVLFFLWFTAGYQLSKKIPVIRRAFSQIMLDTGASAKITQELLDTARTLLHSHKYSQAILHAATSLEYELRRMLNLGSTYSYVAVMSRIDKANLLGITSVQLNKIVISRKNISSQVTESEYGEKDAKDVIELVAAILTKLSKLGVSDLYY